MSAGQTTDQPGRRRYPWWISLGLGVALASLAGLTLAVFARPGTIGFVPAAIRSHLRADYGADPRGAPVAAVNLELAADALRDQQPTPASPDQPTATLVPLARLLQTPIPTVTLAPGQPTPTSPPPTATPSPTASPVPPTPTQTKTAPPPTETATGTPTVVILPTRTPRPTLPPTLALPTNSLPATNTPTSAPPATDVPPATRPPADTTAPPPPTDTQPPPPPATNTPQPYQPPTSPPPSAYP